MLGGIAFPAHAQVETGLPYKSRNLQGSMRGVFSEKEGDTYDFRESWHTLESLKVSNLIRPSRGSRALKSDLWNISYSAVQWIIVTCLGGTGGHQWSNRWKVMLPMGVHGMSQGWNRWKVMAPLYLINPHLSKTSSGVPSTLKPRKPQTLKLWSLMVSDQISGCSVDETSAGSAPFWVAPKATASDSPYHG